MLPLWGRKTYSKQEIQGDTKLLQTREQGVDVRMSIWSTLDVFRKRETRDGTHMAASEPVPSERGLHRPVAQQGHDYDKVTMKRTFNGTPSWTIE